MSEITLSQRTLQLPQQHPRLFLAVSAMVWWLLYQSLAPASEALVAALPVNRASHFGGARGSSSCTTRRRCCCC
jgi:hypothetical protein